MSRIRVRIVRVGLLLFLFFSFSFTKRREGLVVDIRLTGFFAESRVNCVYQGNFRQREDNRSARYYSNGFQ